MIRDDVFPRGGRGDEDFARKKFQLFLLSSQRMIHDVPRIIPNVFDEAGVSALNDVPVPGDESRYMLVA